MSECVLLREKDLAFEEGRLEGLKSALITVEHAANVEISLKDHITSVEDLVVIMRGDDE